MSIWNARRRFGLRDSVRLKVVNKVFCKGPCGDTVPVVGRYDSGVVWVSIGSQEGTLKGARRRSQPPMRSTSLRPPLV